MTKKIPTLDLHGFRTEDVSAQVDRFLMASNQRGDARVRIMTGKGTGAVRQAVTAYLKLGGFPFQIEKLENGKPNEGVLLIFLD